MKNNKLEVAGPWFKAHVSNYIHDKYWRCTQENNQQQFDYVQYYLSTLLLMGLSLKQNPICNGIFIMIYLYIGKICTNSVLNLD